MVFGIFKRKQGSGVAAQSSTYQPVATFTPRNYKNFSEETYVKNVIGHRCISLIAQSVASVEWKVKVNGEYVDEHPLLNLLYKPNPSESYGEFWEKYISYLLLAGNSYVRHTTFGNDGTPLELYLYRPDRVEPKPGVNGFPARYEYVIDGARHIIPVDQATGESELHQSRYFHPLNDWLGLSKVQSAAYSIDQHNAAGAHNAALLQNGMRPSGILNLKSGNEDVVKRVESAISEKYQGVKNAGKPLILAGSEVGFIQTALSPTDMDFTEGKREVAREICAAFGVPHQLIVPGEATYRNMEESRLMLWEDTILPVLEKMEEGIMPWLSGKFRRDNLEVCYNRDSIVALEPRRRWKRDDIIRQWESGLITREEARELLGYDEQAQGTYSNQPQPVELSMAPANIKAIGQEIVGISDEHEAPEIRAAVSSLMAEAYRDVVREYGDAVVDEIGRRSSFQISIEVQRWIDDQSFNAVKLIDSATRRFLRAELQEAFEARESIEQIEARVRDVFSGDLSDIRAKRIAVTESTKMTGYASQEAIMQSGIEKTEWLATIDTHTRDSHSEMDGQVITKGEKFTSPNGYKASYPGGFGIASEDINCRCAVAPVFDQKSKERSTQERAQLWEKREVGRLDAERKMLLNARKMFKMQGEAVIKRLREVTA